MRRSQLLKGSARPSHFQTQTSLHTHKLSLLCLHCYYNPCLACMSNLPVPIPASSCLPTVKERTPTHGFYTESCRFSYPLPCRPPIGFGAATAKVAESRRKSFSAATKKPSEGLDKARELVIRLAWLGSGGSKSTADSTLKTEYPETAVLL